MIFRALVALRPLTKWAYRQQGVGVARLADWVRVSASRRAPEGPLLVRDFAGSSLFECYLREHMGSQIYFRGSYSTEQLAALEHVLHGDDVFIDAGANQGEFTVFAAAKASTRLVIAIEPVEKHRRRLLRNVELNRLDNVVDCGVALGERQARLPIYDSDERFHDGTHNEGLPTLYPRSTSQFKAAMVDVRTLDDIVAEIRPPRVSVIKLDIEGGEFAALRGAERTIERDRPALLLEIGRSTCVAAGYEPEELVTWLQEHGYVLSRIEHGGAVTPLHAVADFQNVLAMPAVR